MQWSYYLQWEEPRWDMLGEDWGNSEVRASHGPWFGDFFAMVAHCHRRIARIGRPVDYEYFKAWEGFDGANFCRRPMLG